MFQRLNFPLPNCPRFDELQHETQTSKEFQNRIQPYMVRGKTNKQKSAKQTQEVRKRNVIKL